MGMLTRINRFLLQHSLRKRKIPLKLWHQTIHNMPLMQRYTNTEKMHLRLLASQILNHKLITPVKGFELTEPMQATIATQAALLVFGLECPEQDRSLTWLRNWREILVYPAPFHNGRQTTFNEKGLPASWGGFESGETHYQGGIIINWQDDQPHPLRRHANQVLLHEMAHKLDMLDGDTNGHPPLHSNMNQQVWFDVFSHAFAHLNEQLDQGINTTINPYAATDPAEFFAVTTEYFFEAPRILHHAFPDVYQQLSLFYRQDPLRIVI